MEEQKNNQNNRREFLKKVWVVPTLLALGTMEVQAKKKDPTLSELCEKTGQNSLFCKCLKDPNYNPACKKLIP